MSQHLSPRVRWIHVEDGAVVFEPESGRFLDLNESAAELWDVLQEGDWDRLVAVSHLIEIRAVEASLAKQMVDNFLAELLGASVLTERR